MVMLWPGASRIGSPGATSRAMPSQWTMTGPSPRLPSAVREKTSTARLPPPRTMMSSIFTLCQCQGVSCPSRTIISFSA